MSTRKGGKGFALMLFLPFSRTDLTALTDQLASLEVKEAAAA